ncbi:MAG: class I SAM-dependent methyltransferase [Rhodospirillaceae bacterium]
MSDASNTERFTGLAETYAKFRPTYPDDALAAIGGFWGIGGPVPKRLVDVGAGTGISTRALFNALGGAASGWEVHLVEPNDDMREQAKAVVKDLPGIAVVDAQAESLPFSASRVGLLNAAQAAHWFDRPRFYDEAKRVLAPGGTLCILYNNRSLFDDPLMAAFESLVEETASSYKRNYRSWDLMSELNALDWAAEVTEQIRPWVWKVPPEAFAGLMLSRSKMRPFVDVHGPDHARALIIDLAVRHANADGTVDILYQTQAGLVRKRA